MRAQNLRRVELFEQLTDVEFASLAKTFQELSLPADHLLFENGQAVDAFYVLRIGEIVLYREIPGKPAQLVARLEPYHFCGEFGLFAGGRHTASARSITACELVRVARPDLDVFLREHPSAALRLQRAVAKQYTVHASAVREHGERHDFRIRIDRRVVLRLDDGSLRAATLDNLSPGGLSLRGLTLTWELQQPVRFVLGIEGHPLRCVGRVAWQRGTAWGIAFTERDEDHDKKINQAVLQLLDPAVVGPRTAWAS